MFEGSFLLEYFLQCREHQVHHKNDGHDTNVPFHIVPGGYRTFFDTSKQGFKELDHIYKQLKSFVESNQISPELVTWSHFAFLVKNNRNARGDHLVASLFHFITIFLPLWI